jgi:hypothetical protein
VHLAELLVGEPERVELPLGVVLDEAGLVELNPGRALPGEFLDHLAVDLEAARSGEGRRSHRDAVGGLSRRKLTGLISTGPNRSTLHRLSVLVKRFDVDKELRVGPELWRR